MEWLTHSQTGYRQAARYLLAMRLAIIASTLVAVAVAETVIALPYRAEALLLCLLYAVLATLSWLWFSRRPPTRSLAVTLTLAGDLALISAWLYFTGGYTNPLVSLLLLPIAVAIILVPLSQSIALTLAGIAAYTVLVLWHAPVMSGNHMHQGNVGNLAELHLGGMWVTFALTAAILLLVVGTLAQRLRLQQSQLAQFRENRLRDEQIISLGLSAAAVAHRLGTPLNTVTLLLDEIRNQLDEPAAKAVEDDLQLMEQQLALCSGHLQQLTKAAVEARGAQRETLSFPQWVARLRESATLLWPAGPIHWPDNVPSAPVAVDATLDQAILNLLANALTASPLWVKVSARTTEERVELVVEDHGDGLEAALQGAPGEDIVESRDGLGVGLFLSNATIQRLGGTLRARADDNGTTMVIDLPVAVGKTGEI